jgi:hypothetical protein
MAPPAMTKDPAPPRAAPIRQSPDLNRAVYQRFLESDYPEALRLAELVLEKDPNDAVAQVIRDECLLQLERDTVPAPYDPSAAFPPEPPDDDTQPMDVEQIGDEPTGPTLSLANRSDAAREVYRMFLGSDYAPALALAEELLARHPHDPMIGAIVHECRAALEARFSVPVLSVPPAEIADRSGEEIDSRSAWILSRIDGTATIQEVADMGGMQMEDVLALLERFVAMGVLTLRPPAPPS